MRTHRIADLSGNCRVQGQRTLPRVPRCRRATRLPRAQRDRLAIRSTRRARPIPGMSPGDPAPNPRDFRYLEFGGQVTHGEPVARAAKRPCLVKYVSPVPRWNRAFSFSGCNSADLRSLFSRCGRPGGPAETAQFKCRKIVTRAGRWGFSANLSLSGGLRPRRFNWNSSRLGCASKVIVTHGSFSV